MPPHLRLFACLLLAALAFGTSLANAQTAPAYFREDDTPSTCAEKCKQQKTLITTLDEFTPRQRLEMLFGAPFKIVHNKRYLLTWYGGEQVDLFVLQERDSQEPQAIATIPRGLAANDAPNVPATLWSDDNKRLDVGDITLAQAITWDQQDLDTGARKNDDVQFVNAKLGYRLLASDVARQAERGARVQPAVRAQRGGLRQAAGRRAAKVRLPQVQQSRNDEGVGHFRLPEEAR